MVKIITKLALNARFEPSAIYIKPSRNVFIKLTLNLPSGLDTLRVGTPAKRRLELIVVKSRLADSDVPLFPKLGEILRTRSGNKVSRAFRHIFENKRIKKVLGLNLAAAFLSTSLMQFPSTDAYQEESRFTAQAPFVLETKRSIRYPVNEVKITQGYKMYHPGIDLDGVTGDPIYPIMDGKVLAINYSKYAYGNAILINHGSEITSLYAHLSKINVSPNQEVTTESIIGEMGATGRSFGDHLHLEIRDNGVPFNPMAVLGK